MRLSGVLGALIFAPALVYPQVSFDPAGALSKYAIARFAGSGNDSIQAMASDAAGNVYVAGTTTSPDLPMKHAAQPAFGEALLMRSADNGKTWKPVGTSMFVPLVVSPHPTDPQTLFVGAQDGIYKTIDSGATWRRTYIWTGVFNFIEIAVDPANPQLVYAIQYAPGISVFLASADGGETWQARTAPFPYLFDNRLYSASLLWVDPNGSGTVVLGFAFSSDRGVTWKQMADVTPYASSSGFTVPVPGRANWVYAATATGAQGGVYMSTDWGTTWTQKLNPDTFFLNDLIVDLDQPDSLYAVSGNLYVSNNGAGGWTATNQFPLSNLALVSRKCGGGALLFVSYQGVVASPDFGTTVQTSPLSNATTLTTGPACTVYAVRSLQSDVFVAKLSPSGDTLWSTFLGGSGPDTSVAISLDASGNVYVAGNTSSSDFPATLPRTGPQGSQNVFVAKLDSSGNLLYSEVIGGEGGETLTSFAVDPQGNAYLAGRTTSKAFPTTPGVFQPQAPQAANGFVVRLATDGIVAFASYVANVDSPYRQTSGGTPNPLNGPQVPIAIAAERDGSMLIGGHGTTLSRIPADGSSITPVFTAPGQIHSMQSDALGNIFVAGMTGASWSLSGSCYYGSIYHTDTYLPAGDVFLLKLQAGTLAQRYSARLTGACQSLPGEIQPGPGSEVTIGVWSWGTFEQQRGLSSVPSCAALGPSGVARFAETPSKLVFSSYVDMCGSTPAVAAGGSGFLFAGVTRTGSTAPYPTHSAVLRLPVADRQFGTGRSLQ